MAAASNETCCTRQFRAGQQQAAYETYLPNIAATAERERTEAERAAQPRWHE